jgi:hypothetical protein
MKVWHISPFTEVAGKGREVFHRERECPESKSKVLDLEGICWMGESGFAGWIGARNDGGRASEVRKSIIPLRIVHSISHRNPDKRRFMVYATRIQSKSLLSGQIMIIRCNQFSCFHLCECA